LDGWIASMQSAEAAREKKKNALLHFGGTVAGF